MHTELTRTNFNLTEHCRLFPDFHCKAKDEAQINKEEEVAVRGLFFGRKFCNCGHDVRQYLQVKD